MIYHGSTIQDLKIIEAKESTQNGYYVYGTPNMIIAAMFAISQKTGKPYPLKLFLQQGNYKMAERFENQFESLKNMAVSIYILDDKKFKSFKDDPYGYSSGDDIELRAEGPQEVKTEIKINNVLKFLKDNGVEFIEYKDRAKAGIPETDKYFVQGILRTYLWKIEEGTEDGFLRGETQLEEAKQNFPQYSSFLEELKKIIMSLSKEEAKEFVEKFYDKDTDKFDDEFIKKTVEYVENNKNSKSPPNHLK